MYMIKITEDKVEDLATKIGKSLKYMGQAMSCLEEMQSGSEMGERNYMGDYRDMGMRGGYRSRFRDEDYDMGERRGVPGSGRYGRY